jgi:uroporphyrinogen-III synthase
LPAKTAVLITSSEAFSLLWQALDGPARARLLQRPCVVSSERLSGQARDLGFTRVLRAADARPASLLARLALHAADTGFR